MDAQKLTDLLRSTIDPNPERRKAAEEQLAQVNGFMIMLLLFAIEFCTIFIKLLLEQQSIERIELVPFFLSFYCY